MKCILRKAFMCMFLAVFKQMLCVVNNAFIPEGLFYGDFTTGKRWWPPIPPPAIFRPTDLQYNFPPL